MRLAIICEFLENYSEAIHKFERARMFFKRAEDIRGLAWSLSHLAICKLSFNQLNSGIKNLEEALQIKSDIGECSFDDL